MGEAENKILATSKWETTILTIRYSSTVSSGPGSLSGRARDADCNIRDYKT